MAKTSKKMLLLLFVPVAKLRFVLAHEIWLFSCTKKYSRGAEYVNGAPMLIRWQFISIDMLKTDKCNQNELVRPLKSGACTT